MERISKKVPVTRLISRQIRLWDYTYDRGKRQKSEQPRSCITISRETGSQGTKLAHSVAARLDWHLFDKELIELIAKDADVRKNMVESFDEMTKNEMHNWLLTLLSPHMLGAGKFHKHLLTVILSIAEQGQAVILGRGGNFIVPPDKALRLKVTMPLAKRIDFVAKQGGLTKREATELIARVDRERLAFVRKFFHRDADDPLYYDLVLNMASVDLETAEEIVIHALEAKCKFHMKV